MITIIGSINMDLIATTERLPEPGETVTGTDFATAPGGKGANQALAARRAGASVRLCGAVGDDGFATEALALLDEAGADLGAVRHLPGPTGTALILVGGDGENMIAVIPAANGNVTVEDAEQAVARMDEGDTLLLQMEIPEEAVAAALSAARARSVTSILNIAPLSNAVARLAPMADIVIANETEFARLSGSKVETLSEARTELTALHKKTGQCMIVTLGADGVLWARDGQIAHVESLRITPVDTVGAGDTFCGYLAQGLDSGMEFAAAIRRAAVAGALACLKPGAQPSIPLASDVDARL
ncbi:MAG: ribokinase [Hoeflea sp.]|uniref:ribokinase n=1 Tax=Hoeflea sp. TaxID=1940281 RepID=UPI001E01D00B|nr:ribokinase [Hoeflea sp.]MBU4531410.1 ribokinase [Alphaproteobacteria bacterium]MBU4544267.1 ribokinase [Alphaproteobacteria bacterium]MBU4550496.1 ribokinase [Alphaproteobacteria bacterium]MBV1724686.1 ribokinase [Hoeflea sp.]MBV1760706.1 ribokinase [Hoeflea sp.]